MLLKSVLLTLLLFALGCAALEYLVTVLPPPPTVERALEWLAPVLVFVLLWLLGGPVQASGMPESSPSARSPKILRSAGEMRRSLMLASRRLMSPSSANSQFSFP